MMWSLEGRIALHSVLPDGTEHKEDGLPDKVPGNCHFVSICEQSLLLMRWIWQNDYNVAFSAENSSFRAALR
jgi:hypothetical protein